MAETYVTLHGLARAVTNLLQRTNTRTMFTAAHPIGEIIETTPNSTPTQSAAHGHASPTPSDEAASGNAPHKRQENT